MMPRPKTLTYSEAMERVERAARREILKLSPEERARVIRESSCKPTHVYAWLRGTRKGALAPERIDELLELAGTGIDRLILHGADQSKHPAMPKLKRYIPPPQKPVNGRAAGGGQTTPKARKRAQKAARNAEIRRLRKLGLSLSEIGDRFGMTNSRAHQICKDIPVPKREAMKEARNCEYCGGVFLAGRGQPNRFCSADCGRQKLRGGKWSRYVYVDLQCEQCRAWFQRSRYLRSMNAHNGSRNTYCSRECYHEARRLDD